MWKGFGAPFPPFPCNFPPTRSTVTPLEDRSVSYLGGLGDGGRGGSPPPFNRTPFGGRAHPRLRTFTCPPLWGRHRSCALPHAALSPQLTSGPTVHFSAHTFLHATVTGIRATHTPH